jgi:hypothetical protein
MAAGAGAVTAPDAVTGAVPDAGAGAVTDSGAVTVAATVVAGVPAEAPPADGGVSCRTRNQTTDTTAIMTSAITGNLGNLFMTVKTLIKIPCQKKLRIKGTSKN